MTTQSSVIGRKSAVVLGEALNEAFTYQVQLSFQPLRLERVVAGDDLYDFLIARGYAESFCDYMLLPYTGHPDQPPFDRTACPS